LLYLIGRLGEGLCDAGGKGIGDTLPGDGRHVFWIKGGGGVEDVAFQFFVIGKEVIAEDGEVFEAVAIGEAGFLEAEGIGGEIVGVGELGGSFCGLRISEGKGEEGGAEIPAVMGKDFITGGLIVGAAGDVTQGGARARKGSGGRLSEEREGAVAEGITGGV
jgi:hypothetical protein